MAGFFCILILPKRISSIYSNIIAPTENKQRTPISLKKRVFCIDPLKILCLVRSAVVYERIICKPYNFRKKSAAILRFLSDITENLLYYR